MNLDPLAVNEELKKALETELAALGALLGTQSNKKMAFEQARSQAAAGVDSKGKPPSEAYCDRVASGDATYLAQCAQELSCNMEHRRAGIMVEYLRNVFQAALAAAQPR